MNLKKIRKRIRKFGCDKPGGRPMSPASAKEAGPGNVCVVTLKSGPRKGQQVAYRKKEEH